MRDSKRNSKIHSEEGRLVRCAIYTRKSSEEGLEQEFNSLHAQREACEAYIASQRHEGWRVIANDYDDGGFSGGSMERPALKRLIDDLKSSQIDCVVVYKIDRLTRSLFDFARLVEVLDASNASFVSVTQSFNTTTSMGRLTLNVLLSFAQFVREVTGERIRDKIAAARARGMFMGGNVPLGYDLEDHHLVPNRLEAKRVQTIFEGYLKLGSVAALKKQLCKEGATTKQRAKTGGSSFSTGHLYWILQNPVYIGQTRHKGKTHPGRHEAIIDDNLWNKVQAQLQASRRVRRNRPYRKDQTDHEDGRYLLAGLVVDDDGRKYVGTHTTKMLSGRNAGIDTSAGAGTRTGTDRTKRNQAGSETAGDPSPGGIRRYRYYVRANHEDKAAGRTLPGAPAERIAATRLEEAVTACLASFLGNPSSLIEMLADPALDPQQIETAIASGKSLASTVSDKRSSTRRDIIQRMVTMIILKPDQIEVRLNRNNLLGELALEPNAGTANLDEGSRTTTMTIAGEVPVNQDQQVARQIGEHDLQPTNPTAAGDEVDRDEIKLLIPIAFRNHGTHRKLVIAAGDNNSPRLPDENLVRAIARAQQWFRQLMSGNVASISDLAKREQTNRAFVSQQLPLAFLAPDLLLAIETGNQPSGLTVGDLASIATRYGNWDEQRKAFAA
ncbi:MAG: recombinase family protein [Nitratireductor sp.]